MTYHRAKEIFTEAIKLAPEDRGAYLDEHCGDDADLRAKVDSLLLNHSSTVKDQSPQRIAGEYQRGDIVGPFLLPAEMALDYFRAYEAPDTFRIHVDQSNYSHGPQAAITARMSLASTSPSPSTSAGPGSSSP